MKHVNKLPCNSRPTAWALQVAPLLSEVSTICPWCPKHLIWVHHVVPVLCSQSDLCLTLAPGFLILPAPTKASEHLLPVWDQTRTAEKTLGGLAESLSEWWVAQRENGAWQLPWWLEEWKVELAGRPPLPALAVGGGEGGWTHLANGWCSTNAAHLQLPDWERKSVPHTHKTTQREHLPEI